MSRCLVIVLFVLGVSLNRSSAAVGGATLWSVSVATADAGSYSDGRKEDRVDTVGDDGVIVVTVRDQIFEVVPQPPNKPFVRLIPLSGRPVARVGGRSFVWDSARTQLRWIDALGNLFSLPVGIDAGGGGPLAFSAEGDPFTVNTIGQRAYLTKWSTTGEIIYRKPIGKTSSASSVFVGANGNVFITAMTSGSGNKIFAFSSVGEFLWATDLGDFNGGAGIFIPTSDGGMWAWDSWGNFVRLTSDGFSDTLIPKGDQWNVSVVSPSDDLVSLYTGNSFPGGAYVPSCGLADGGVVYCFSSDANPAVPVILRLSNLGTTLWVKRPSSAAMLRIRSQLGNGIAYFMAWTQSTPNRFECSLTAIDLGAPAMDSSWPFYYAWPDGSRRARPRSHAPPTVTMIAKPRHSGAVIEFGVEDGLDYSVESANKPEGPWRTVGTVPGVGYGARFTDPTSVGDAMRLYRVQRSR